MNEIAILSGKGGTGKTSICAAFATLNKNIILADCDVDAANLHLIMQPQNYVEEQFSTGQKAQVDTDKCTLCQECISYCRFDAISISAHKLAISVTACDGCKLCVRVCPQKAISMFAYNKSRFYIGNFRNGTMVHARLAAGEDNSGKLVAYVKKKAREMAKEKNADIILIDGPPGIACPVIATLSGTDKVLLVTEPTVSGLSDLKRIILLLKNYKGKTYLIINKYDTNENYSHEIVAIALLENIRVLGKIPYNRIFTDAMLNAQSVTEFDPQCEISNTIRNFWNSLTNTNH